MGAEFTEWKTDFRFFFFPKKPNPQNFTNCIWFLNYVFTRNKKLEEWCVICQFSFRRWSLFQLVMKYQYFQRRNKKLFHNSFAFCAMFSPAQEKTVTIQMEYAVHAHGICWCDPGGNHFDPGGSSPGKKGCWKEEAQQELIAQFTTCFSSRSWGSRTGSPGCLENYLWVGFWQAGFDFQGVLGTVQKTVCSAIPTSNLLAAIPHWNTEINHCCGQWLMCNTSCAPAPLWLLWDSSWALLVALSWPNILWTGQLFK